MTQPSPTPVPDHGTGWGLLLLLGWLYATVALLGAGTLVAVALDRIGRRMPPVLSSLVVAVLLGALGISGFTVLVAASAGRYDVVALLVLVVFLPLALGVSRGTASGRVAVLAHVAMAWSLPFLLGVGLVAFVGARGGRLTPELAGVAAVVVVVAGTSVVDRLSLVPGTDRSRE